MAHEGAGTKMMLTTMAISTTMAMTAIMIVVTMTDHALREIPEEIGV